MTPIIIIVMLIIVSVLSYFKFIIWRDTKDYIEEHKEIFEAHKKLGYPELTKEEQFTILDHEDLSAIKRLTDFEFVPSGLLDYYITIKPIDYFEHLKRSDILDTMDINKLGDKFADGFYIEQKNNAFHYIFNERQTRVFEKKFKTKDKLLKYLAYDRLRLYAPKYKKKIRLK